MPPFDPPLPTRLQRDCLIAYACRHGDGWKGRLLADWDNGDAPDVLQAMLSTHGEEWLAITHVTTKSRMLQ